jgi:beta-glucosidase
LRRTALLASATLLTALLPLGAAGTASGAGDPAPVPVDRFEGEVPFAAQPAEGIFTWGGDSDDPPTLALTAREDAPEGDKVLTGSYDISGYGGFTHDFAADRPAHDWSAHKGIRLWWEGRNTGKKIPFEIKDGGANGEASELWTTSFTDDFTGWKQIELPFTDFTYRTDYQPVGRSSTSPRCGATPSPSLSVSRATSPWTTSSCTGRPTSRCAPGSPPTPPCTR